LSVRLFISAIKANTVGSITDMARSARSQYAVSSVTPDFSGEGTSTPVKTENVTVTADRAVISIFPIRKTSSLGMSLLTVSLLAFIPMIVYLVAHLPSENGKSMILAIDIGVLGTLVPITVYLVMQAGNRITIDTSRYNITYRNALGNSVSFRYKSLSDSEFRIVYFSNTTAQSTFNRKGWAVFYRDNQIMFRLNMERWDVADLWWMSENLPARIVVVDDRTGFRYIEKLFPGYFPMFASKPVASFILVLLGTSFGLLSTFILWSILLHAFPA